MLKKEVFKLGLVLFLIFGATIPVYAQNSNFEDGVMGENSNIDYEEIPMVKSRSMISNGWYYDENGIKCFKDNNNNLIGKNVKKVIDVSTYNGTINWDKVSKTDIDGVIIRIFSHTGGYYHIDDQFVNNLNGCRKYNIPFGIYIYDYSNNSTDANNEADMIIKYLKQYNISSSELSYPVYLDMERDQISKTLNEQIVDTFVNKVTNAGYNTKVYSYRNLLQTKLNSPIIYQHVDWVAAYTSELGFVNSWYSGSKGWQYTNGALVDGIDGYVDMSVWYDQDENVSKYYGWKYINNQWYYGNEKGILQIGWELINNQWYYMNSSGVMQTGWLKSGNTWYYLNSSGAMVTGLQKIGNNLCYFNSSGAMQIGWQYINSKWYYFNQSGYAVKQWQKINSIWYYFNEDFQMQTGWQKINNKWYYLCLKEMVIDGKHYYEGYMTTGWIKLGNTWYYLDSSGAMQTGWQKINNKWYYLCPKEMIIDGKHCYEGYMATGWIKLGNTWYYLNSSGAMVTGTVTINGKKYRFNSSGAWIG